jgi:hypothetical protein
MAEVEKDPETGRFLPGNTGGTGRPKGSRNKLGEAFIQDVYADWVEHGVAAIVQVRQERPHEYLKVVAGMLPKELKITNESDLSDEQLIESIRQLDAIIRPFLGVEGTGGTGEGTQPPARSH